MRADSATPELSLTDANDDAAGAHALGRLAIAAVGVYMGILLFALVALGVWPTFDLVIVGIALLALALGRGRLFLRDWIPFLLIFLAWEAMRGIADNFGARVHSDAVIALERMVSLGVVPTVELQRFFYRPGEVGILDVAASTLYAGHFVFPLGVAFVLWLRDRRLYYRFAATLLAMALAAFIVYLLLPVAPPRFAHLHGEALAVTDVMGATIGKLDLRVGADWVYANLSPNDNAAFPSLHAAFPLLALLFVRTRWPRAALAIAVYTAAVWFAIAYLGHHYVVDIVGGAAFAIAAYVVCVRMGLLDRLITSAAPTASTALGSRPSPS